MFLEIGWNLILLNLCKTEKRIKFKIHKKRTNILACVRHMPLCSKCFSCFKYANHDLQINSTTYQIFYKTLA